MTRADDLAAALERIDWGQVVLSGGPPCFHIDSDGTFCLRAQQWAAHNAVHDYVSLADLLRDVGAATPAAWNRDQATCEHTPGRNRPVMHGACLRCWYDRATSRAAQLRSSLAATAALRAATERLVGTAENYLCYEALSRNTHRYRARAALAAELMAYRIEEAKR